MMVPRVINGKIGFDCVLPFVTKEGKLCENQEGLIMNNGWIPIQFARNNTILENLFNSD